MEIITPTYLIFVEKDEIEALRYLEDTWSGRCSESSIYLKLKNGNEYTLISRLKRDEMSRLFDAIRNGIRDNAKTITISNAACSVSCE